MTQKSQTGKNLWVFPDAEIPPMGDDPDVYGHESIIVLNPNSKDATLTVTLFWTDKDPVTITGITVRANRVRCFRATEKMGFLNTEAVGGEQYSVMLESDTPIVAQYGRLDVRQSNMAFYATPGYKE